MSLRAYLLFCVALIVIPTAIGCGDGNQSTVVAPDESVTQSADVEAFYNQAPEDQQPTK
jgi:hypothetical protein